MFVGRLRTNAHTTSVSLSLIPSLVTLPLRSYHHQQQQLEELRLAPILSQTFTEAEKSIDTSVGRRSTPE